MNGLTQNRDSDRGGENMTESPISFTGGVTEDRKRPTLLEYLFRQSGHSAG